MPKSMVITEVVSLPFYLSSGTKLVVDLLYGHCVTAVCSAEHIVSNFWVSILLGAWVLSLGKLELYDASAELQR